MLSKVIVICLLSVLLSFFYGSSYAVEQMSSLSAHFLQ